MTININDKIPQELPRHFILTVYPDGTWKMTERRATRRDRKGQYVSDYSVRFRKHPLICAYADLCPFRASSSIEEM